MEPLQQFQWCLQRLKLLFALFAYDLFAKNNDHVSKGFVAFSLIFGSTIVAGLYTVLNYDESSSFGGGLSMFSMAQVINIFTPANDQIRILHLLSTGFHEVHIPS